MTETDPGKLGDTIARLEIEFTKLADHPDPYISRKARLYLIRVQTMRQEIRDAIQNFADAQARGNLD